MSAVVGQQGPASATSEFNTLVFVFGQLMQKVQTATLVQVMSVTNSGGVSPVGTVSVQPMVNQMTGDRTPVAHGTIFNIPYLRLQGGTNAVILDPQVGDIGIAVFASRDISAVKAAKAPANPGSYRMNDWADGLYFGGFLNGTPTQYIAFAADGITVHSPVKVTISAPTVEIDASTGVIITSPLTAASGDVTAEGTSLHTHVHNGVMAGSDDTGPPV